MYDEELIDVYAGLAMWGYMQKGYLLDPKDIAEQSYKMAYAMLREREKYRGRKDD